MSEKIFIGNLKGPKGDKGDSADLSTVVLKTDKGAANGVASLDGSSHIPSAQLAAAVLQTEKAASSGVATLDGSSHIPSSQLAAAVLQTEKAAPSGVATLDGSSHVPSAQLANALLTSAFGANNGVATLDSSGQVPLSELGNVAGGIQSITFVYDTEGGVPASGSHAAGDVAIDQRGILRVCTSDGTPGVWRRVSAEPWQFFLDDYTKRDLELFLATVTSAAPTTLNTTPITAVQAVGTPTFAHADTGGSVSAGAYQAKITYVNKWGETTPSSAASTTTTTGTSTLTVTPPSMALSLDATGYKVYMTGPGGSTFFQQGGVRKIGEQVVLTAPPSTGGNQPPSSDTTAAAVFTSTLVDAGKDLIINGGTAFAPTGPMVGHIVTVVSPTQATFAVDNGNTITVNAIGCASAMASDDRLAIDQCIQDAFTYAVANDYLARVYGGDKAYSVGQSFFQSAAGAGTPPHSEFTYNTQVRLPAPNPSGNTRKLDFGLIFPGDGGFSQFWMSFYPNVNCGFFSFGQGTNGDDATFGRASIVGAPNGGGGAGTNGFFNAKYTFKGMQTWRPGWANTIGIDLAAAASCFVESGGSFAYASPTDFGGSGKVINPIDTWMINSFWKNKTSMGIRTPQKNNNEDSVILRYAVGGCNTGFWAQGEGLVMQKCIVVGADAAMHVEPPGGSPNHDFMLHNFHWENCNAGIFVNNGLIANYLHIEGTMDSEITAPDFDISDAAGVLRGTITWEDTFRAPAGPTIIGAENLKIYSINSDRAVKGAPTYSLGTAFQNPWFQDVEIRLAGGTTTGILIGRTSAECTTSVGTTTPVNFKLPTGWWLNVQGSVKPTTFNAIPT